MDLELRVVWTVVLVLVASVSTWLVLTCINLLGLLSRSLLRSMMGLRFL